MDKSSQHEIPGELLSAWCDGELSPEECARVEQLLHESPAARREVEEIRQLSRLLADVPQESAPPELVAETLRRCKQELEPLNAPAGAHGSASSNGTATAGPATAPAPRGVRWWKHPAAGLAAAVTLCAGLTWMFLQRDSGSPEMVAASRTADAETLGEPATAGSPAMNDDLALAASSAEMAVTTEETGDAVAVAGDHAGAAAGRPAARFAAGAGVARMAVRDRIPGAAAPGEAGPVAEAASRARRHTLRNVEDVAWERIQAGEVVRVLDRDDGQIAVVELTVVNVSNSLGRLQVLLSRHSIGPLPAGLIAGEAAEAGDSADDGVAVAGVKRKRAVEYVPNASLAAAPGGVAGNRSPATGAEEQFSAVFVQTSPDRLASVLRQIRREQQFSELQFVSTISADEIQLDPVVATAPAEQPLKRQPAESQQFGQRQQITVAQLDRSLQHSAGRLSGGLQSARMARAVDGTAASRASEKKGSAPDRRAEAEKEQLADRSSAKPVVAPRAPARPAAAPAPSAVPADAPVRPSATPAASRTATNQQMSRRANGAASPRKPAGRPVSPVAGARPAAPIEVDLDRATGSGGNVALPSFQSPASLLKRGGAAGASVAKLAARPARGAREAAPATGEEKDARRLKSAATAIERQQAKRAIEADKRDADSDRRPARPQATPRPEERLARPGARREGKPAGEVAPTLRPVRVLFVVRGTAPAGK